MSGTELSRVRTELQLLPPKSLVVNQSVLRSREPTLLCNQVVSGTSNVRPPDILEVESAIDTGSA